MEQKETSAAALYRMFHDFAELLKENAQLQLEKEEKTVKIFQKSMQEKDAVIEQLKSDIGEASSSENVDESLKSTLLEKDKLIEKLQDELVNANVDANYQRMRADSFEKQYHFEKQVNLGIKVEHGTYMQHYHETRVKYDQLCSRMKGYEVEMTTKLKCAHNRLNVLQTYVDDANKNVDDLLNFIEENGLKEEVQLQLGNCCDGCCDGHEAYDDDECDQSSDEQLDDQAHEDDECDELQEFVEGEEELVEGEHDQDLLPQEEEEEEEEEQQVEEEEEQHNGSDDESLPTYGRQITRIRKPNNKLYRHTLETLYEEPELEEL
jgi:hypothetical protein